MNNLQFGFSQALGFLNVGRRVKRIDWRSNEFIFLVPGSVFKVNRPPLLGIYAEGEEVRYHSHIDMKTVSGFVVPWVPKQEDILGTDWVIVEEEK